MGDRGEGEEEERGLGFEWISGYEGEATRLRIYRYEDENEDMRI